jgi:hypothetical protein
MSMQPAERLRRLRTHSSLSDENDDEVLTFKQWCELNKISLRTGQRILCSGQGPIVTKLSARRIGITRGANRAWQASRARV